MRRPEQGRGRKLRQSLKNTSSQYRLFQDNIETMMISNKGAAVPRSGLLGGGDRQELRDYAGKADNQGTAIPKRREIRNGDVQWQCCGRCELHVLVEVSALCLRPTNESAVP